MLYSQSFLPGGTNAHSSPPPRFCIAIVAAFMLASCGGGGSSGSGPSSVPSRAQQIFTGLNDSNTHNRDESVEIDVFGDSNLLVTVHITQGGFAMSQYYANFSAAIPVIHTFLDNDETWTENLQLTSPADSSLFPGLSQTAAATNITRSSGTAEYRGLGMGAMQVSGTRKLLLGSSIIEIDFATPDFDLALGLAALDSDEITDTNFTEDDLDNLLERDVVFIEATDIGFDANGALTGTPEFTIDTETIGTAEPLENQTATLQGGFRGPAGEILILSGSVTNNSDTLVWGTISREEP